MIAVQTIIGGEERQRAGTRDIGGEADVVVGGSGVVQRAAVEADGDDAGERDVPAPPVAPIFELPLNSNVPPLSASVVFSPIP